MAMSARQLLNASVSRFLFEKLETEIAEKLADNKKPAAYTPVEKHKTAIYNDVIDKAKDIADKYSLKLMPADTDQIQNNIVYVKLVRGDLHYTIRNVIGEGGAVEEFVGVITKAQLPELAA